jgi:hypothetical protein
MLYYIMGPPSYMWSLVDRSVVTRRMTAWLQHRKQWHIKTTLFYKSQYAVVNNTKERHDNTQYKFTAYRKRRHLHYIQYTQRSGPFIVSPRTPPAVTAVDRWAASTSKQTVFTCYFLHVGHSWRLWKVFKYGHLQYLLQSTQWKHRGVGGTG